MKIALLVPSFPKLSETFIVNQFLGLLERGLDVHVVCQHSLAAEWARFPRLLARPDARRRVHVCWPHEPRWRAAFLLPAAVACGAARRPSGVARYLRRGASERGVDVLRRFYLDAELIRLQPDVLHFEFGALAVGRMYLKDWLGCKVVVSFRGYDLNYVGLDDADHYREVWERADALHLLGEDLWRRARRRGCPADKPHSLIPPAINAEFFDPGPRQHAETAGIASRPLRVLSVGRLEWKKGYEFALQAIKLLKDRGVVCDYEIVGDGDHLEVAAFARHQLGLEKEVRLPGPLPPSQIKERMLAADVLLHAAVSEGFCNAVMEAQAMRLPVVTSDADGLPENVVNGGTGFVVPRRDPAALADKLALLAAQPSLRQQMGEAGRQRVLKQFRLTDQVSAFEQLYARVANRAA